MARAEPVARPAPKVPSPADRDGVYLGLGPLGALAHSESRFDGGFGGELTLARVRWGAPLTAIGVAAGAMDYARRDGGRMWAEVLAASRRPLGVPFGLSAGVTAEVDRVRPPGLGWQATLWLYAGVTPFIRIGSVPDRGTFAEAGIKVTLPALRWR